MTEAPVTEAGAEQNSAEPAKRKVCLLTGASGTLGTTFCQLYAQHYDIVAVYREHPLSVPSQDMEYLDPMQPDKKWPINAHPVYAVRADLARDSEIDRVVDIALARHDAVDVIINAQAHYGIGSMVTNTRVVDDAEGVFRLNAIAPLKLATAMVRRSWRDDDRENAARNRCVVNVSSTSGMYVFPQSGQAVYGSAKAALNLLTGYMAEEFAPFRIRVNALAPTTFPGRVPTERVVHAIARLVEGSMNGKTLVVTPGGENLI